MKKIKRFYTEVRENLVTLLFVTTGLSCTVLTAYISSGSFEIVRDHPEETMFFVLGYITLALTLFFFFATVVLTIKGPEDFLYKEEDELNKQHND